MITPAQAPESCPFCGAQIVNTDNYLFFACGTTIMPGLAGHPRNDQTARCIRVERERLTRERDNALMMLGVYKMDKDDLKARVKRLEDAGDAMVDAAWSIQDWNGTHLGDMCDGWTKAKEDKL